MPDIFDLLLKTGPEAERKILVREVRSCLSFRARDKSVHCSLICLNTLYNFSMLVSTSNGKLIWDWQDRVCAAPCIDQKQRARTKSRLIHSQEKHDLRDLFGLTNPSCPTTKCENRAGIPLEIECFGKHPGGGRDGCPIPFLESRGRKDQGMTTGCQHNFWACALREQSLQEKESLALKAGGSLHLPRACGF